MLTLKEALARTQSPTVHVKYEQVVELIGEEKAKELCYNTVSLGEGRTANRGPMAVSSTKATASRTGLAGFHREPLLKAIVDAEKGTQSSKEDKDSITKGSTSNSPSPEKK